MIKYLHFLQKLGFFMALSIVNVNAIQAQTTAGNASFRLILDRLKKLNIISIFYIIKLI
jgi:hypothetical protein